MPLDDEVAGSFLSVYSNVQKSVPVKLASYYRAWNCLGRASSMMIFGAQPWQSALSPSDDELFGLFPALGAATTEFRIIAT